MCKNLKLFIYNISKQICQKFITISFDNLNFFCFFSKFENDQSQAVFSYNNATPIQFVTAFNKVGVRKKL